MALNASAGQQYNTPPTVPSHQPTFHQQSVRPYRASATNANSFVRNKFNANQFYGEDEEESSRDEDDDCRGGWNSQQSFANPNRHQSAVAASTTITSRSPNMTSQPNQNSPKQSGRTDTSTVPAQQQKQTSGPVTSSTSTGGNSSALSTNELLRLFGASPTIPATAQTEGANKTAQDSQLTQQESTKFELVLPPAALDDSSSDESDDGEAN